MFRYEPKLVRVNLGTRTAKEEVIPEKVVKDFVGARGFAAKYLYDEVPRGIEPLGPDNKLIFTAGPLAGTGAQAISRWIVAGKSPLTETFYRSCVGADFGAWLRFSGLQVIIIEGRAEKPVYFYIENGHYEIKDAAELWGLDMVKTQERLQEVHGNRVRTACIGPAGEKLVRYSGIMSGRRCAGRGGMGTVMGSKNLKAIAIRSAQSKVPLPNPLEYRELARQTIKAQRASPMFKAFSDMGTLTQPDHINAMGIFPTRNFREGRIEGAEKIGTAEFAKIKVANTTCYMCQVHCGNVFKVKKGRYAGTTSEGPDFETLWVFSGPTGCTDVGAIVAADAYCDEQGFDTISAGVTIGFAFELFERGILTEQDTGGLKLTYGNTEAIMELLHMIGERRGLGDILAEGTVRAAARIGKGAEAYAMHVKGLELPGYDPRGAKAHGLNYLTANVGANHCYGYCGQEIFNRPDDPRPVDRFAESGYADITKLNQDRTAMSETGIVCNFCNSIRLLPTPLFVKLLASATGIAELDNVDYMWKVGERIFNLERAFNVREGFDRKNDVFPKRLLTGPLKNAGPSEGQVIKNLDGMLDEYYALRGWDSNGIPTAEKLKELGLEEVEKGLRR